MNIIIHPSENKQRFENAILKILSEKPIGTYTAKGADSQ